MAMAHAVEGRFPFLDHRLVEFAATIPPGLRLRGWTKSTFSKRAVADLAARRSAGPNQAALPRAHPQRLSRTERAGLRA